MRVTLHVWRQRDRASEGRFVRYELDDVSEHMSFLEMLDVLNQKLIDEGTEPVAFASDCREGICGTCGLVVNGIPHGPQPGTAVCQLHMRVFEDGDEIWVEPWRARAFPLIKDLVVDRSALDHVTEAGGFISASTGSAPDGNAIPIPKATQEHAMDAAECIQCGACVAACPNGSAALFVAAKVSHLGQLPQGQPERFRRVTRMVQAARDQALGSCSNMRECEAVCPKRISIRWIARMNRDFLRASLFEEKATPSREGS